MMSFQEILIQARDLISKPYAWTKGEYEGKARTGGGQCYCAAGAVYAVSATYSACDILGNDRILSRSKSTTSLAKVTDYNDKKTTTKKDIIALFNRGIKRAAKAGI